MVGIKIARAHDASGIDNISVYIGQTIPKAETLKRLLPGGIIATIILVTSFVRGVQYMQWVMHKCIMVKVGENEIHVKYVKSR